MDNGNNAIIMRATIARATTAKKPAHQWQQHQGNVGDDVSSMTSNEGSEASLTTVETHLRIDSGNNTIVARVTIAIATTATTPVHQQQ